MLGYAHLRKLEPKSLLGISKPDRDQWVLLLKFDDLMTAIWEHDALYVRSALSARETVS